jgi:hypothetical protein
MFLKILIVSVILVAFTMLALGIKLLFNKEASFSEHACALENGELNMDGSCASCKIKELANCKKNE